MDTSPKELNHAIESYKKEMSRMQDTLTEMER